MCNKFVVQVQYRTHQKTFDWHENHPQIFERHLGPWVAVSERGPDYGGLCGCWLYVRPS
jgi:hypothetical protein